jgi:translocation and assembly module TamB
MPYKLNGKLQILHGEFLDDPSEYSGDKKVNLDEYKKYLPEKNKQENVSFVEYNLAFESAATPILVKNNMTEIYLKGVGQINGNPMTPEINARVEAVPAISKFKFKGHDFIINQGYVEIKDSAKVRTSDLKFVGISKINDYEMKLDLSGKIDKLNINLSSEPALAQEDLLSLLTIGVTSDMSKNLEAGERKFVTTVGIGTLLVDQLKINEDLNSTLGLKLSVLPEFKEEVTSLVQGKSAVSETASSRLKSSTKIKVNKQINKQVDVSLSSTVGGTLEQKQEVNINYNFNKSFSLEGVYEVKPSEDTSTPNSVGADLKYRWSF